MKWNLRLAAAQRGIWKASDLQRTLAEHGLVISAGKMSGLWSGQPASIKLDDLDIICAAIGCTVTDLLIAETGESHQTWSAAAAALHGEPVDHGVVAGLGGGQGHLRPTSSEKTTLRIWH